MSPASKASAPRPHRNRGGGSHPAPGDLLLELVEALLARIERLEPALRSFVTVDAQGGARCRQGG